MTERSALALFSLVFVGFAGWYIGDRLTADALGMAVGVLFGILAGIPVALMVMASHAQNRDPSPYHHRPPPPPITIAGAPQTRGERIEQAMCDHGLICKLVSENHLGDGKAFYDFAFRIGTQVSSVDRYVQKGLARGSGSQFRIERRGGEVRIYEQTQRVAEFFITPPSNETALTPYE